MIVFIIPIQHHVRYLYGKSHLTSVGAWGDQSAVSSDIEVREVLRFMANEQYLSRVPVAGWSLE